MAIGRHGVIHLLEVAVGQPEVVPSIGVSRGVMQTEAERFNSFWIALEIPQQIRQAKGGLVVAGLIQLQKPQLPLRFGSLLVLQQRHRQAVARFSKAWIQINGLPIEA